MPANVLMRCSGFWGSDRQEALAARRRPATDPRPSGENSGQKATCRKKIAGTSSRRVDSVIVIGWRAGSIGLCLAVAIALVSTTHAGWLVAEPGDKTARSVGTLIPTVEIEEDVYRYQPANNGAGPLWCHGSTCLVRIGDHVFAGGMETLPGISPLNNCRWTLFERAPGGWQLKQADEKGHTREPSPLAGFPDGNLFLSANPTLAHTAEPDGGPARPEILRFLAADAAGPFERILPVWSGTPAFSEHSYRSFAADGPSRELVLFQNIGYTHAEWTFRDAAGKWSAQGKLAWPWGAEYDRPQPIRVCYPNVALRKRAGYFCGVSDIVEPYQSWRQYKKQLTGREWDYDFRRLFYTWTPDITTGTFRPWIEIASRDKTCGRIGPGDLYVAPDGAVHLVWTEQAIDQRLREKFFPNARQSYELNYAVIRDGKVIQRRSLLQSNSGGEVPASARFQVTPDNRLFVLYYVQGRNESGQLISEDRVMEVSPDGTPSNAVRLPLKKPFTSYFTTTVRGGSPPSHIVEMLGERSGLPRTISYARIRLW